MEIRKKILKNVKKIVIKIGTHTLVSKAQRLQARTLDNIIQGIAGLKKEGMEIILVSSGAIGLGMLALKLSNKPKTIPEKQAVAAVGQSRLMQLYEQYFARFHIRVGQVLLTSEDFNRREQYLNIRNTFLNLFKYQIIPVVNENDSVATEEIKFGDNDTLAAHVANLIDADLLIILTDTEGLYDRDPNKYQQGNLLHLVETITPEIEKHAAGTGSEISRGGMRSKIQAAKIVTQAGGAMIIANGQKHPLKKICSGEILGTFFVPRENRLSARKRWIVSAQKRVGAVYVDFGGKYAILNEGKSLLAAGIKGLQGKFKNGELVEICDVNGHPFASGLVNYNYEELNQIKGKKSSEIEKILGYKYYDEVVHRDNMVLGS